MKIKTTLFNVGIAMTWAWSSTFATAQLNQKGADSVPQRDDASAVYEDFKGPSDIAALHLGALAGMGVVDSQAGFVLLGTASKKIVNRGFAPDINNSVSIEAELGPLFTQGTSVFFYGLHLRWDFQKDENWTFYGLGGLSGQITPSSLGSRFILFPRFGVGAMYQVHPIFGIRAELSREVVAAGVTFPLGF